MIVYFAWLTGAPAFNILGKASRARIVHGIQRARHAIAV